MASSRPTGIRDVVAGRGIPPKVVIRKNCIDDVKCHTPQILLHLKSIKLYILSSPNRFFLKEGFRSGRF